MAFSRSSLFDPLPRRTISQSISFHQKCQLDDSLIDRLDRTEVLGGQDGLGEIVGHTGCVNALSWSPSGQLLASGSDDRNVILWKMGSENAHSQGLPQPHRVSPRTADRLNRATAHLRRAEAHRSDSRPSPPTTDTQGNANTNSVLAEDDQDDIVQAWPQRQYPSMDLGILGKIQTGHRANIFSVKWAPNASERRLFTCAGDSHVRVFDINYMSSGFSQGSGAVGEAHRTSTGNEYNVWSEHSGACIRLFKCHRGRAKRISTEVSPDVFLTCAEDGDVRQMDLRVPHTCRSRTGGSCPPPLAHYSSVLYSLSVSKLEPWLFAVAGESPRAYLHDRRMIPRLLKRDWGMSLTIDGQQDALTMCVRSFGLPSGGFETPWAQNDGRTALVDARPRPPNRRLLMGNRDSITACKLSEHNGRDLLVSYSSGHIYRFDIYDEPGILQANRENARFSLDAQEQSRSPEEAPVAAVEAETSANDEDVDLEKGQAGARQTESERENRQQQQRAQSVETNNDDGEMAHEEDTNMDAEEAPQDTDEETEISLIEGSEVSMIEQVEQDTDEDEGDLSDGLSDEDLAYLLEQDSPPSSNASHIPTVYPRASYKGHCNKDTVKDVSFAGGSDDYVMSGSDDGNWFLWDKFTSQIKGIWQGDSSVVNVMAMHPDLPVFAISGIDESIKIFAPIAPPPNGRDVRGCKLADRMADKEAIVERNERQISRGGIVPGANLLWRLHPGLFGMVQEEEGERDAECVVM